MLVASLPMYDMPEVALEVDALWRALAAALHDEGVSAPDALTRAPHREVWRDPRLLLTQCCGWDVRGTVLKAIAAPVFDVEGCAPGEYRAAFLVREGDAARVLDDVRGTRAVINERGSYSGRVALARALDELDAEPGFFKSVRVSGAHRASVAAVREGRADFASVDVVVLEMLRRHAPEEVRGLRVLDTSRPCPAPPFATREERDAAPLAAALERAARCGAILLRGVVPVSSSVYEDIVEPRFDLEGALDLDEVHHD